uniref:Uncharacterized protein n=1 Tax=Arundo donax TaxID=35708 RepID=A0A0A8Y0A8_ARUDO
MRMISVTHLHLSMQKVVRVNGKDNKNHNVMSCVIYTF